MVQEKKYTENKAEVRQKVHYTGNGSLIWINNYTFYIGITSLTEHEFSDDERVLGLQY